MRRLLLIPLLLIVFGFVSAQETPTPATPPAERFEALLSLSEYVPQGAPIHAVIRTDSAYFETLDQLLSDVQSGLPPNLLPGGVTLSTRLLLETASNSLFNASFEDDVRPWLGNSAAFTIHSLDPILNVYSQYEVVPSSVAFEITDRSTATDFIERYLARRTDSVWTRIDDESYTLFSPADTFVSLYVLVRDDVLFMGTSLNALPLEAPLNYSLADDRYFLDTLTRLPGETYNAAAYIDASRILSYAIGSGYSESRQNYLYLPFLQAVDPIVIGGTILGQRTLTLDAVVRSGNMTALEAIGITPGGVVQIDPEFTRYIPPSAALVIHGTRITGVVDFVRQNLGSVVNAMLLQNPNSAAGENVAQLAADSFANFSNVLTSVYTGASLDDWTNWTNSNYLVFISPKTVVDRDFPFFENLVEYGVIAQVTDPVRSEQAMRNLARALPLAIHSGGARGWRFREEVVNNTLVLVISNDVRYADETWHADGEFAIGANGEIFAAGTYRAVVETLQVPDAPEVYTTLQPLLLSNPSMVWYLNSEQLRELALTVVGDREPDTSVLQSLVTALGDGTASLTVSEQGDTLLRFTLSLAEPDLMMQMGATATEQAFLQQATAIADSFFATSTAERLSLDATITALRTGTATPFPTLTPVPTQGVDLSGSIASVCLITDVGRVNDGTFNQSAYNGMVRAAEEIGLDTNFIETQNQADYRANIDTCVTEGYDAIATVGFLIADATYAAASTNPNVYFIGVDQFYPNPLPNLVGLQFREDQAGFLAGVMAALMTESGVIAGVYGEEITAVVKFRNGFEQGARYINPDVDILGLYIASFIAPAEGAEAAEAFIGEGADVIFGAGGPTGSGGILRAAEQGVYVIGVDQDEFLTTFGSGETPGAENIITSAIKRVDEGVYQMLNALSQGDYAFPTNSQYVLDASVDGVGFAPSHLSDVPEEVTEQVQQVFESLKDGTLTTGVDPITGDLLDG
jgi:basic membrane protein A and related proteins